MKKVFFISMVMVLMAFIGPRTLADYRDAYTGNYTSKRTYKHINDAGTSLVYEISTYTMSVQKGEADSTMVIGIDEGSFTLKLKTPDLISSQSGSMIYGKFFATDSIYVNFIPSKAPFGYLYRGKKN